MVLPLILYLERQNNHPRKTVQPQTIKKNSHISKIRRLTKESNISTDTTKTTIMIKIQTKSDTKLNQIKRWHQIPDLFSARGNPKGKRKSPNWNRGHMKKNRHWQAEDDTITRPKHKHTNLLNRPKIQTINNIQISNLVSCTFEQRVQDRATRGRHLPLRRI